MHFDLFRQIVANSWESYIDEACTAQKTGKIMVTRATLVYPTLLLFVETADHFLAEAYGATEKPQSLAKIVHKVSMSSAEYLFQFAVDDMLKAKSSSKIQFGGKDQRVRGLYFMRSDDQNAFITRFPFIDKWAAGVVCKGGFGPAVYFADTFRSGFFANCLFLNHSQHLEYGCLEGVVLKTVCRITLYQDCWYSKHIPRSCHCKNYWLIDKYPFDCLDNGSIKVIPEHKNFIRISA